MGFQDTLAEYLAAVGRPAKDLARAAGLSPSAMSRYLSGERVPHAGSDTVRKLAEGIAALAEEDAGQGEVPDVGPALDAASVRTRLDKEISGLEVDYATFIDNFSMLIETLGLNRNELARSLSFDPSYLSRILSGQRRLESPLRFAHGVARFVSQTCADGLHAPAIAALSGCTLETALRPDGCFGAVLGFLGSSSIDAADPIGGFLLGMDRYDPEAGSGAIAPEAGEPAGISLPFGDARTFLGLREAMDAELAFFAGAVASEASDDIIMYSDMPMMEMARSGDFAKRWVASLALATAKGLRICSIHDVYRPMEEMAVGLELWIPLYMTGRIESYYLPQPTNGGFTHYLRSASDIALHGEGIAGRPGSECFTLTRRSDEVALQRQRAQLLLEDSLPLIRPFPAKRRGELEGIVAAIQEKAGPDAPEERIGAGFFDNIDISVMPGRYALVEKRGAAEISFLVEHPLLVAAIESFNPARALAANEH